MASSEDSFPQQMENLSLQSKGPYLSNITPPTSENNIIPPALRTALFNPPHRRFLISLENDLLAFIASNTDSYLLSPMNSFYRLLTHKAAEYYSLGHSLDNERKSIIVFKNFNPDGSAPEAEKKQRLSEIVTEDAYVQFQHQYMAQNGHFIQGFRPQFHQPYYAHAGNQYMQQRKPPAKTPQTQNQDTTANESIESENSAPAPREFKLMKRVESTDDTKRLSEATNSSSILVEESESPLQTISTKSDHNEAVPLEKARASRETEYQKARERIFKAAQEDVSSEEEEEEQEEGQGEEETDRKFVHRPPPVQQYPVYPPSGPLGYPPFQTPFVPGMISGSIPQYYQYPMQHNPQFNYYDPSGNYANGYQIRGGFKKRGGRRGNGYGNYSHHHHPHNYTPVQGEDNQFNKIKQAQQNSRRTDEENNAAGEDVDTQIENST